MKFPFTCIAIAVVCPALAAAAQNAGTTETVAAQVPSLIQFQNVATDQAGNPIGGKANITFSLYDRQAGGEPLWTETQKDVELESTGHYSVQLGATRPDGVSAGLFSTGESRWLGVRIDGGEEQPRVLLVSVPYALKAGDASTIGGLPPSAFVRAEPGSAEPGPEPRATSTAAQTAGTQAGGLHPLDVTGVGTNNYLPLWTTASTLGQSAVFQSGTGAAARIGINNIAPATTLDVNGTSTFRGALKVVANGTSLVAGNPSCGAGYAGLGFRPGGKLDCTNYAVLGGPKGDTYINSSSVAGIHFRSNNNELMTINNDGNVDVIGQNGGGNLSVAGTVGVSGRTDIAGNASNTVIGDPGCGAGYAGLGFSPGGVLVDCFNYALLGSATGDTFLNSTGASSTIHFRNYNDELANIDHNGNLTVVGKIHSGNLAASVSASNPTVLNPSLAKQAECLGKVTLPKSDCAVANMTLTEETSGGPVLIIANIGGVGFESCVYPNFALVMDDHVIATQVPNSGGGFQGEYIYSQAQVSVQLISMQTPAAGTHTFQVQEYDEDLECSKPFQVVSSTTVSLGGPNFSTDPGSTRTLIVREF
jgi:hypothetical protein